MFAVLLTTFREEHYANQSSELNFHSFWENGAKSERGIYTNPYSEKLEKAATADFESTLDGRIRGIVIAESLARVVAAIRIVSVRWAVISPSKTQKLVLTDPAFVAPRLESRDWRSFV